MRKKALVVNVLAAILFLIAAGCATVKTVEHKYFMKGQILDVSDGVVYLCIGSAEGAKAGQEFPVYRYERLPYVGGKPGTAVNYKREEVGAVKITQVVHEHYAEASIVRGNIKVHDVAELSP